MKLRVKGNSIRLRLTQGEVARLVSTGAVQEEVGFGPASQTFTYTLEAARKADAINAEYKDNRLSIRVPFSRIRQWADSNEVGIEADLDGLHVLVEKDFACLKPRAGEDEDDMFPNPSTGSC